MFASRELSDMDSRLSLPQIGDQELQDSQAAVRALVVHRLELIWATIEPHVNGSRVEEGWSPDVRFVEAGIRCLDRLARVYRLQDPGRGDQESLESTTDAREVALRALDEIEARMAGG
jgi:hypothetical protein